MALVGDFEGAGPWHLFVCWGILVVARDQVAVEVERQVGAWDLIAHRDSVGNAFNDCLRN